ncbi:hypothetical protein RJ640_028749 [Escallonia rubra]|uniref:50S ribosomal protein L14, chloroplastic n=1 Tax=Escallonia rubra TaxID=112253 RepID=A0AA88RE16_9ASTE|nr:hypothetical protein RJ640_028749 [Escallonia rubra]
MCIRIIGASNRRYAHIGDVIVAVIKEAVPNMPLERSEVVRAVIVRTCKELKRDNGMIIRYDDNAAVVIDQEGNPKGTRVCTLCITAAAGTELADAYSPDTAIASSPGKEVHDPGAFYLHAALLRQAFAHYEKFSNVVSRFPVPSSGLCSSCSIQTE